MNVYDIVRKRYTKWIWYEDGMFLVRWGGGSTGWKRNNMASLHQWGLGRETRIFFWKWWDSPITVCVLIVGHLVSVYHIAHLLNHWLWVEMLHIFCIYLFVYICFIEFSFECKTSWLWTRSPQMCGCLKEKKYYPSDANWCFILCVSVMGGVLLRARLGLLQAWCVCVHELLGHTQKHARRQSHQVHPSGQLGGWLGWGNGVVSIWTRIICLHSWVLQNVTSAFWVCCQSVYEVPWQLYCKSPLWEDGSGFLLQTKGTWLRVSLLILAIMRK